jgi:serine/threonine protein kinase/uncharacterized protein (DUF342 family)
MPSEPSPSVPGYRVVAKLGQGGMATVWRAEQTALGREVALKVVSRHLIADPKTRDRFLREAKACARVVHPNVITCHDAGEADGQLFMALELVTGGDLRQLLTREGGRIEAWRAVHLLRDCLTGLAAIQAAGLIHRDIKPGNIFLTAEGIPKLADLGLARGSSETPGGAELTMPGMIVGTPAYIAPEQARSVSDLDIRADLYALGATLFHCIAGRPPYPGDDPMGVLMKVLNDPVPDLAEVVPGCPAEIAWLARALMAKDRNERPANAGAALDQVARVLDGHAQAKPAPKPAAATPAKTPAARPATTDIHRPTSEPTPAAGGAPRAPALQIDKNQLAMLAKRIIVDQGGLRASLALAPGANFPRVLLDQIIAAAGVCHGILEPALHAATLPKDLPRRLILARGTPPSPGIAGRSVRAEGIPPLETSVSLQLSDDALQAVAYTRPGQVAKKADLEHEVKAAALRYGLDAEALRRLVDGPPAPGGRMVVARGRAVDPGRRPGDQLVGTVTNTTVDQLASEGNLRKVVAGETIAIWDDGLPAHSGMDVLGRTIAAPAIEPATPEGCTGAGTEMARDREGRLVLNSRVNGFVQRQPDGCVRVVGIFAIEGDMGAGHPPVVTEDVVVVRGSVRAGASITSSSDVVIMGDLEDAVINAGGNVEVDGRIGAGAPIAAGGAVVAHGGGCSRTIMAGSVRIEGEIRDCELRATGDVSVKRVVGGSITAGGNLRVEVAGDADGTTTFLWAGRHLTFSEEAKLAQLTAARADSERGRVMRERQALEGEVQRAQASKDRLKGAAFVNTSAAKTLDDRLRLLELEAQRATKVDETARRALAASRQQAARMADRGVNGLARIEVGSVAHAGVVVQIADAEAEALKEPRLRLKIGSAPPGSA